jgi:actin related protein 2/3 complex, subunit 4
VAGQAGTLYLSAVRATLDAALCLQNFGSQTVERHNKPEVEAARDPELLLAPVVVSRSAGERVLIEGSVNALRVQIRVKQADELEALIVAQFMRFMQMRAESFVVLRRKPRDPAYSVALLITNFHTERMWKHKLVDFVIDFMTRINQEISEMQLVMHARARASARVFLEQFQ